MQKIVKMLPYLLICEVAFMLMALIGVDTGGLLFLLFIVLPIACFAASVLYGIFNPFSPVQLLFPLFTGLLFTATFYAVSQEIVWLYTAAFTVISLAGNGAGYLVNTFRKKGAQCHT